MLRRFLREFFKALCPKLFFEDVKLLGVENYNSVIFSDHKYLIFLYELAEHNYSLIYFERVRFDPLVFCHYFPVYVLLDIAECQKVHLRSESVCQNELVSRDESRRSLYSGLAPGHRINRDIGMLTDMVDGDKIIQ